MGYDLTIQGLIRKRADLAGQVEALQCQLASLFSQLAAIDTAIRVFKPAIDLDDLPERVPPAPFTGMRGDTQRVILEALRAANRWTTTLALAEVVMDRRGLDKSDKIVHRLILRRTGYSLTKLRNAGKVKRRPCGQSRMMEWRTSATIQPCSR